MITVLDLLAVAHERLVGSGDLALGLKAERFENLLLEVEFDDNFLKARPYLVTELGDSGRLPECPDVNSANEGEHHVRVVRIDLVRT